MIDSSAQSIPSAYLNPSWTVEESNILAALLSSAERESTCLQAPHESFSYHRLISQASSVSSVLHLKQVERKPVDVEIGPLKTRPIGRRTVTGEVFGSASL